LVILLHKEWLGTLISEATVTHQLHEVQGCRVCLTAVVRTMDRLTIPNPLRPSSLISLAVPGVKGYVVKVDSLPGELFNTA